MRAFTLNRDQIKGIAMMTMLLNHISQIFMTSGTFWAELFLDVGWFTAITMCYFLVEGYAYTHDKRRYALRLAIFAVISQPAYLLAFPEEGWYKLNILFTLLLSFVILVVREQIARKCWRNLAIVGLFLVSLVCDWAILAPAFTLLFAWAGRDAHKRPRAFLASILLFGAMNFLGGIGRFSLAQNLGYPCRDERPGAGGDRYLLFLQRPARDAWTHCCEMVFLYFLPGTFGCVGRDPYHSCINKATPGRNCSGVVGVCDQYNSR